MTKDKIYNPPQEIIDKANISEADFEKLYKMSIDDPENFWSGQDLHKHDKAFGRVVVQKYNNLP